MVESNTLEKLIGSLWLLYDPYQYASIVQLCSICADRRLPLLGFLLGMQELLLLDHGASIWQRLSRAKVSLRYDRRIRA